MATASVIGRLLVERRLIAEGELTQALVEQEVPPRPLGTLLVERGSVSEGDLRNDFRSIPAAHCDRDEAWALAQVDGRRTVREIVTASRLEEIVVVSVLARLVATGVLLVKIGLQSGGEPKALLRTHRDAVWAEVRRLFEGEEVPALRPGRL